MKHFLISSVVVIATGLVFQNGAEAVIPFDSAKVSLVENKVFIGDLQSGRGSQHQASTGADVTAKQFVATDTESRAELKFADTSVVRIGQNSIFSFEAGSRTLSLKEGTMIFFIPHGGGGGTIKTPSFTAAITGTVGKVTKNTIAVIKGEVNVNVNGKWYTVHEGEALNVNGNQVRLFRFNPSFAFTGQLFNFDGVMPGMFTFGNGGFLNGNHSPIPQVVTTTTNRQSNNPSNLPPAPSGGPNGAGLQGPTGGSGNPSTGPITLVKIKG